MFAEQNFDTIVDDIYEQNFIDNIFLDHQSTITREHFIMALTNLGHHLHFHPFGGYDKEGEAAWLFNPNKIREIFKQSLARTKAGLTSYTFEK